LSPAGCTWRRVDLLVKPECDQLATTTQHG
jgi:hypothetical protein